MSRIDTIADYPLAENRPDLVKTARGKALTDITLDAVLAGEVTLEDLRITPQALIDQARVATLAGRPTLGRNFERAAELISVPQDYLLKVYELLRPGRAKTKAVADLVPNEVEALYTNGPAGGCGAVKRTRDIVSVASILVNRSDITPAAEIFEV